jgi:hypothetical protein
VDYVEPLFRRAGTAVRGDGRLLTTFARQGSAWTPFDIRSGNVQRLATEPGGGTDFAREHQVAFWRSRTS